MFPARDEVMAKLFRELFCWLWLARGLFTIWQSPRALLTEGQCEKFAERELVLMAVGGDADGDRILRNITAQRAMEFIPPAENCAPV